MQRADFHKLFKAPGPVVIPVVHVLDTPRTLRNVREIIGAGAAGCFLINHDFTPDLFLPIIRDIRTHFPEIWLGVNFLAVTGRDAFPMLGTLARDGCEVDAYWADDARINETGANQEAEKITEIRRDSGWRGLYFGGTCFKKQREVAPEHYHAAAERAVRFMDVVTTSGVATGQAAKRSKIDTFRKAVGDRPLALASGVTPQNAELYAEVDCFMVATGINEPGNFYDIDPDRLDALMRITRRLGRKE